jgi:thiol:disulfide interchange protein DsbC
MILPKILLLLLSLACASAFADEASVRKLMESTFPNSKISNVVKTAYGGLYEVYFDNEIIYTDEQVSFVLVGNLIDAKTNQNVTQQRLRKLTAVNVKEIPLDLAIRKVKGNGKRQLIVFSDPMCPYCQQLERELEKMNNITVHVMLYPVEVKFKGSTELSKQIWCSSDRVKAWDDWMLRKIRPTAAATCKDPIARLDQVGTKLNINNTPALIFADGGIIPGMVPAAQIEKYLRETPGS